MRVKIQPARYLVLNANGTELVIVSGPLTTQRRFVDALIKFVKSRDFNAEHDTMHILAVQLYKGRLEMSLSDFGNWFMDAIKTLANLPAVTAMTKSVARKRVAY